MSPLVVTDLVSPDDRDAEARQEGAEVHDAGPAERLGAGHRRAVQCIEHANAIAPHVNRSARRCFFATSTTGPVQPRAGFCSTLFGEPGFLHGLLYARC